MDKKYNWDLSEIYKNQKEFEKDETKVKKDTLKLLKFKGKVIENSSNLYEVLELDNKVERLITKLYMYAHLSYALDTTNKEYNKLLNRVLDLNSYVSANLSFIEVELTHLSKQKLKSFIKEEPKLKEYEFTLNKIIKSSKHLLSLENEVLLSTLSPLLSAGDDIFEKINDADAVYGSVYDKDGKSHKLTKGTYAEFMSSKDEVLRKDAFYKMHEYYENRKYAISECLSNSIKTDVLLSQLRKYKSPLEAKLESNNIKPEFYDDVIKTTRKNINLLYRFLDDYKKVFNIKDFHIYDINLKYENKEKKYDIDEIQDIITKALGVMDDEYKEVVELAFKDNWIDLCEKKGKISGAFSSGSYDTKPYILLNYVGSFNDLETLIHELGHSIHSYLSKKYAGKVNHDYTIFQAEIASTTNEILLNEYLLKEAKTDDEKKFILSNILTMFKSTVFRQVEFAEFEKIMHDKCQAGEKLTEDDLTNAYLDLQKFYYNNIIVDEISKYEALRIPHFYESFYVYQYATGLCIGFKFAKDILDNKKGAKENYMKFLKSGGKDYPFEILKSCGIDLNKIDIIEEGMKYFEDYLNQFEKLI